MRNRALQNFRPLPLLLAICAVQLAFVPRSAVAEIREARQINFGTARVLDQGSGRFGILSPLGYGVSNRLTVESHVIFMLLLTPNFSARFRLSDNRRGAVSLLAHYEQSFYRSSTQDKAGTPGEFNTGVIATFYPQTKVALSGSLLYAAALGLPRCPEVPADGPAPPCSHTATADAAVNHGVALSASAHFVLTPTDLLFVSGFFRYDFTRGLRDTPIGMLLWTHQFPQVAIQLGVEAGELLIGGLTSNANTATAEKYYALPLWPVADAIFVF